jgi:hypothetical protein
VSKHRDPAQHCARIRQQLAVIRPQLANNERDGDQVQNDLASRDQPGTLPNSGCRRRAACEARRNDRGVTDHLE